jgi:hypothetical protein
MMNSPKRRYSKEEFARRGDALVESVVRPKLTAADADKFVAIDIETGEYELDKDEMKAINRLWKRVPDPQIWVAHVTRGWIHRIAACGVQDEVRPEAREAAAPDLQEDDNLVDELLAANPKFQALVAKSKVSAHKPFATGERGQTNG